MTADNVTEAARAEAERVARENAPLEYGSIREAFVDAYAAGLQARTHLAAQEVTEEEVTEAALAMCRGDGAGTCWNYDDTVHGGCTDHTDEARAALSAARAARRDEEKR